MKRLAPAFALSVFVFLTLNANAQNNAADSIAVRATVTNYIEA